MTINKHCDIIQDPETLNWYIQKFDDTIHGTDYPTQTEAVTEAINAGLIIVRIYEEPQS